ncbi:GNAT family N-acetyltransferase [Lolliginicoccus suaedae]|uniref:GNAT family N-acetyltransferase n=1 Tax=Lolliginicoccus suaedae TaxID=2605429 RepID=UPI0011EEC2CC|nr:GNAT family N-acyltransferase [Lolliginicoccus suaedae]
MTTSSVLIPAPAATASTPRYSLLLSTRPDDIEAAQRLRHDVFRAEPGFSDTIGEYGRDADEFDAHCDHLLVRDEQDQRIIGCYRMLPGTTARRIGGFYTATEFALDGFEEILPSTVEMGRACVHPDHRNGAVLSIMWSGILQYLNHTGNDWVLGCVSVPMLPAPGDVPGANVRAVRDHVLARHRAPGHMNARPYNPVIVDGATLDEIPPPPRAEIPPLLRGYLRLGAWICGEPAHDPSFGVADFVTVLGVRHANARYLARLASASAASSSATGNGSEAR